VNGTAHSNLNSQSISRALYCSLALIFLPLAAGKPPAKPAAVKKVTVDDLMEMSAIAEYTDLEDMELAKVANSPRKTRDLLVRMHSRRERAAMNLYQRLKHDLDDPEIGPYAHQVFDEWGEFLFAGGRLKKLKL